MKIGIITLYGNINYGNKLQNYALQEILRKYNNEVDTIILKDNGNYYKNFIKIFVEKSSGKYRLISIKKLLRKYKLYIYTKKYIKIKKYNIKKQKESNTINNNYNLFIVGSDQVWNPIFWNQEENSDELFKYMLMFAESKKRNAYAASFGIEKIPEFWRSKMKNELKKFNKISVREDYGKKIIKKETGQDVSVVLDPTMLLDAQQWTNKLNLYNKPGNYIMIFFLGEMDQTEKEYINSFSNYEMKNMNDINSIDYSSSPIDFLNYIKNSKLVLTDSFHATVFSIIFHVPFVVFNRKGKVKNMDSRINTLLKMTNLEDRHFSNNNVNVFNCDYSNTDYIIDVQRRKSLKFIETILQKR